MTEKKYNEAKGVRRSDLWKLRRSPAHFRWAVDHPAEQNPAMLFGSAVHAALLQPRIYKRDYQVASFDARTKEGKALKQKALEEGKTLITADMAEQIRAIVDKVKGNKFAKRLFTGKHEQSHFWKDPETGERCKCRTDCETDVNGIHYIVDLKTCVNAETEEFVRDALKYGYFMQAAMYTEGVKQHTGQDSVFVFVAVEKDPPYAMNIMTCGEAEIRLGMEGDRSGKIPGYRTLLNLYHECNEKNQWPGYEGFDNHINEITLPRWLRDDDE